MNRAKLNEAGFTLIEVMIALLILVLGLMSAAAMQTRAVTGTNAANRMSERVTTAEQWMEDFMSRVIMTEGGLEEDAFFSDLVDDSGTWQDAVTPNTAIPVKVQYRGTAGYPLENLTTIEVKVVPKGVLSQVQKKKEIILPYIKSTRWN